MKHVSSRLLPLADKNKVIHLDYIQDPVLRRFATDRRVNGKIRETLKDMDKDVELLIPYQVDDPELQLKRYIQFKYGLSINLTKLRKESMKYYLKLYEYGSPREVLEGWGFTVEYDHISTLGDIKKGLEKYADKDKVIKGLFNRDESLYRACLYQAKKKDQSVSQLIRELGFEYKDD